MNNNEPIVLGTVKKGKTGKPLLVLIVLLFIGSIVIILPIINNYFAGENIIELIKNGELINFIQNREEYINNSNVVTTTTTTKSKKENEQVIINKKAIIQHNNFILNNFNITENNIEFKINTTTNINFDKSNYYLVLTKDKEKRYIKLTGEINGSKDIIFNFINKLSSIIEVKGEIKNINKFDYTEITLNSNELNESSLECIKDNEKYIYRFNNNNLVKISNQISYIKDENYNNKYSEVVSVNNSIISLGGNSQIINQIDTFILINDIDLNVYNFSQNTNYNYYSLNTKPKVVNFEMEAKGYDCK